MPRTRKNVVQPTDEAIDQQSEIQTISVSDACLQLETSEQTLRLALQAIHPDDFDSVDVIAQHEFEDLAVTIQRKTLLSAPAPQPEPQPEPQPQPAPLAQQQQPTPPAPAADTAQTLQFLLSQQASPAYSGDLKIESAANEGAATAYREFMAFQHGYGATAQSLRQLNQSLDVVRNHQSNGTLAEAHQAFLSNLQANLTASQAQQQQHQNTVNDARNQANQHTSTLNQAIKGAIQDLKDQFGGASESSLL